MTDPLTVPASEHGVVRVFSLEIEAGGARAFDAPGAVAAALGVDSVDTDYVEVFPVTDLAGVGLAAYLTDGCGVPEEVIDPDRARLDALTGHLMVVLSKAFGGRAMRIAPAAQLKLVGVYSETPVDWSSDGPIETSSARPRSGAGISARPPDTRAGRIGSALFVGLLLLCAAIILVLLI